MSGITARAVVDAFRAHIALTPCAEMAHSEDRFVPLLNVSEFRNVETDRRFYALVAEGPDPVPGSTCNDYVIVELTARWLDAWESQGRMLDDLTALRRQVQAFTRSTDYIYTTQIVSPWRTDYVSLATSAVASIRVRIEYHKTAI